MRTSFRHWRHTVARTLADLIGSALSGAQRADRLSEADEIVRNSPTVLYRLAMTEGLLPMVYISQNVVQWGHSAADLLHDPQSYFELIHPEDRPAVEAALAAVKAGAGSGIMQFRLKTSRGEWRWVENRYAPAKDGQSRPMQIEGVLVDITERRLAEDKLKFANVLLASQKETSRDGVLVVDSNSRIISVNRRFRRIWDLPFDPKEGQDDTPLFEAALSKVKDPDKFRRRVRELNSQPHRQGEGEIELADGRFLYSRSEPLRTMEGRTLGRIWFFRDISRRKKAETALADSEARMRAILEATGDGVAVVDPGSHAFVMCNRALQTTLGFGPADLTSRKVEDICAGDSGKVLGGSIDAAFAGAAYHTAGIQIRKKAGSTLTVDVTASRTSLAGRDSVVVIFHDVTERERIAFELRRERDFSTALIDQLPGIFFVIDHAGRTVRVNAGLAAATGLSVEQLLSLDPFATVVAADRDAARQLFQNAIADGNELVTMETNLCHADGSSRRYLFHGVKVELDSGPGLMGIGTDVTEARSLESKLRASEQRFRTIFSTVSDGILVHDPETGEPIDCNASMCEMLGYSREEILQGTLPALSAGALYNKSPEASARFEAARSGKTETFEWKIRARSGRELSLNVTLRKVAFGSRDYFLSTVHDITELKKKEEKILLMARIDAVTGLPNRVAFAEALDRSIAEVVRGGSKFAVLYLDLDHFKDVNDTLGHPIGDTLLGLVAHRLTTVVRENDIVARFGGDEFAILQANVSDLAQSAQLASRILGIFVDAFSIDGNEVKIGASIGISTYGPDANDVERLLSRADVALYRAKSEERGAYRFFTDDMDEEVRSRVLLANDLRSAIAGEQFFLEYQPQVDCGSGRLLAVEGLLRWRHPKRGTVMPNDFIPVAARNGLIRPIGQWVLREMCRQARTWLDGGLPPVRIAINLSAPQFKVVQSLEDDIRKTLLEFRIPAEALELELTESVLFEASRENNDLLVRLRAAGVRLALDGFGTGYSSLEYLRSFPVDRIKIARNFMADLGEKTQNGIIVRAAISLAHALEISVLAQGVETAEQVKLLRKWGCTEFQGFYFSPPVAADAMTCLLRSGRIEWQAVDA